MRWSLVFSQTVFIQKLAECLLEHFGRVVLAIGDVPLDLLNPFSPLALEREERLGVDAVLVEHKFGPVSRLAAVYAPSRGTCQ